MKKILLYILIFIALVGFFSPVFKIQAQTPPIDPVGTCTNGTSTSQSTQSACKTSGGSWAGPYVLLAPLPCDPKTAGTDCTDKGLITFDPTGPNKIGGYLNVMIRIFIGLCAVLAVVMIVIGGIEYMTSELISSKEAGKERIRGAIFGLLLALGAWTLINQINPDILNTDLTSLAPVTVDVIVGGESSTPFVKLNAQQLSSTSVNCSTNLVTTATSFVGNSTYSYSQTNRNTVSGGKAVVDCSSFVDQVYACAQLDSPGNTTTDIFDTTKGATKITAQDLKTLKVGDLIGWKKGDTAGGTKEENGHVMMYIGDGMIIDAMGGTTNGVTKRLLKDTTALRLTYIKRI